MLAASVPGFFRIKPGKYFESPSRGEAPLVSALGVLAAVKVTCLCGGAGGLAQARGPKIDEPSSRRVVEAQPEAPATSATRTRRNHRFFTANPSAQAPPNHEPGPPGFVGAILY